MPDAEAYVELYWIPLGAGGHSVRINGKVYEAFAAARWRRERRDLYHAALVVSVDGQRSTIEVAPSPDDDLESRGVVATGAVGSRWAGRLRVFRYEVRCWPGGSIPDLRYAVGGPERLTDDPGIARRLLALAPTVPTLVWGRDELRTGDMWNSNSVVAWLIASAGLPTGGLRPPLLGRAPGWNAGLELARGPARPPAPEATDRRNLARGLLGIAAGLAAVALLGPLVGGPIDYHVSETLRLQTVGLDAASLCIVAPLALLAARLTRRGHAGGPGLALGVGAYTSYMLLQYIVGPEYLARPGDNELLFPLYLVLFALGWGSAVLAWRVLTPDRLPTPGGHERVLATTVLPLLALLAFSRYVPALADAMGGTPQDAGYLAGPTFFWTIATLDLGVFLPATVVTCVALVRRREWAPKALYLVGGWFGLVGPAVAAMAIAMYVGGDPDATAAGALFMTGLGLAFAAVAFIAYQPLFAPRRSGPRPTHDSPAQVEA